MEFWGWLAIGSFALAAILGSGVIGWVLRQRQDQRPRRTPPVIADWRPSGRLNAISSSNAVIPDDTPSPYHILVEERRLVEDIAGAPLTELRWRYANRNEVRLMIRQHQLREEESYGVRDSPLQLPKRAAGSSSGEVP